MARRLQRYRTIDRRPATRVPVERTTEHPTQHGAVDVFVSHVDEDKTVALNLALRLEEAGYRTWCYELDSYPGAGSEDEQVYAALRACRAILVVASPESLGERGAKVQNEVLLAVNIDRGRHPIFVLCGVDHATFERHELVYRVGVPVSLSLPPLERAEGVLEPEALGQVPDQICGGLERGGIHPGAPDASRRDDLTRFLLGERARPKPKTDDDRGAEGARWRWLARWARRSAIPATVMLIVGVIGMGPDVGSRLRALISRDNAVCVIPAQIIGDGDLDAVRPDAEKLQVFLDSYLTEVLKLGPWKVVAKAKIDALVEKYHMTPFAAAESLGVRKKIEPHLMLEGDGRRLFIMIIAPTGYTETSLEESFPHEDVVAMARWAVATTAKELQPDLDDARIQRVLMPLTATTNRKTKAATDWMYEGSDAPPGTPAPGAALDLSLVSVAYADDIEALIEEFRVALESRDAAHLAPLFVTMPDQQRQALQRYLDDTRELQVHFDRPDVTKFPDGTAFVTFLRHDTFRDRETGERVELTVRVNATMVQQKGAWKIQGFKRPS